MQIKKIAQKVYIYYVYIQYKRKICKKSKVCYGYLMRMLWVSYGKGR